MASQDPNPLVSVVIPTYNNARYIGRTIDSIITQTYKNIEIIIYDNASTDNTKDIVASYKDERIKYYRNGKTVCALANWNICVKKASADFVAIYHSDDIYEPTIVEKELEFLLNNQETGAVFCLDRLIDENDKNFAGGIKLPKKIRNKVMLNFQLLFTEMLRENSSFLVAPTFMARKKAFNDVGYFDETEKFGVSSGSAGDTEMWLRIAQHYDIGIIKERLIKRRISMMQGSSVYQNARLNRANHYIVLDHFLNSVNVEKNVSRQYEYNKFVDEVVIAKAYLRTGEYKKAKQMLLKGISLVKALTSFRNFRNFQKMCLYGLLLFCSIVKCSYKSADIIIKMKHRLLK